MISEKLRQYKHEWYLRHREECLRKSEIWHKTHPEAFKRAMRKYRTSHQEDFNARQREYYRRHKDKLLKEYEVRRRLEPEKAHAHDVARCIPLASNCELCDSTEKLERHHPDYSEPYIFVTLCKDCHEAQSVFDAGVTNTGEDVK